MSNARVPHERPDWHQSCLDAVAREPLPIASAPCVLDTLAWLASAGGHVRSRSIPRGTIAAYSHAAGEGPERASVTVRAGRRIHMMTLPQALADNLEPDFGAYARALGLEAQA